jgi:hypothetical protein
MSATAVTVRPLARRDWPSALQALASGPRRCVNLEIDTDTGVTEAEAVAVPLRALTFEDGDDQVAIAVSSRHNPRQSALWHYVDAPRHLHVAEGPDGLRALAIAGADGVRTIVRVYPDEDP